MPGRRSTGPSPRRRQSSSAAVPTPAPRPRPQRRPVPQRYPHLRRVRARVSGGGVPGATAPAGKSATIEVRTDLLIAEIDTLGGTLKRVELLKQKEAKDSSKNLVLLGPEHHYEAQSGLTGDGGPNHRTLWTLQPGNTTLGAGEQALEIRLDAQGKDGLAVTKLYRFKRDSYVIDVALEIRNPGAQPASPFAYFQLTHDGKSVRRCQCGGRDLRRPELQRLRGLFGREEIREGGARGHRQGQA